jgi:MFS family permease
MRHGRIRYDEPHTRRPPECPPARRRALTRIHGLLPQGYRELFAHGPYRFYLASSTLGSFASAVQFLGLGWLTVMVAPNPGWALASFFAVRLGVKMLFAVPAGLAADRVCRKTMYAWMRIGLAGASVLAAIAILTPSPLAVALIAVGVSSAAHALDLPAHRALQGDVQPQHLLERAMSLGSSGYHVAALVAPIIAFPLAASVHVSAPLWISAVIFGIAAVPAFAIPTHRATRIVKGASHDVRAALRFVSETPIVVALLLATTLPTVVDKAVLMTLPSAADNDQSHSLGLVLAAPELGAIAVALLLAAINWRFATWIPLVAAGGYAAGVAAASVAGFVVGVELIFVALFLAGCAKTTLITSALAGIQRHVPADMRGRIMTI